MLKKLVASGFLLVIAFSCMVYHVPHVSSSGQVYDYKALNSYVAMAPYSWEGGAESISQNSTRRDAVESFTLLAKQMGFHGMAIHNVELFYLDHYLDTYLDFLKAQSLDVAIYISFRDFTYNFSFSPNNTLIPSQFWNVSGFPGNDTQIQLYLNMIGNITQITKSYNDIIKFYLVYYPWDWGNLDASIANLVNSSALYKVCFQEAINSVKKNAGGVPVMPISDMIETRPEVVEYIPYSLTGISGYAFDFYSHTYNELCQCGNDSLDWYVSFWDSKVTKYLNGNGTLFFAEWGWNTGGNAKDGICANEESKAELIEEELKDIYLAQPKDIGYMPFTYCFMHDFPPENADWGLAYWNCTLKPSGEMMQRLLTGVSTPFLASSYTIWANGQTYSAEDAYGSIPSWGEDQNASRIINDALSSLTSGRTWKEKVVIVGNITITNPLIVHSYTILQVDGTVSLANNSNTDLVKSYNFANLTGTNSPSGIEEVEFTGGVYDGNNVSNPDGGYGFRLYGKRYTLDNVEARNCRSGGIYSEWANNGSVASPTDAMESMWVNVRACFNGGDGITMRGPHDSVFTNCITYCNVGNGISIEGGSSSNYTGGGLQLVDFHSYGNGGDGIWSNEYFLGSSIQSESNDGRGVYILHNDVHLSALQIYNNRGGCGIEIGNATYGPSGVMIEAKTLGNNYSLKLTNDYGGNSFTITCWENSTISGVLNAGDEYHIYNTETGQRYDSSVQAPDPRIDTLTDLLYVAILLAAVSLAATIYFAVRRPKTNQTQPSHPKQP